MIRYIDFYDEREDGTTRYQRYSREDPYTISEYLPGDYTRVQSTRNVTETQFNRAIIAALRRDVPEVKLSPKFTHEDS